MIDIGDKKYLLRHLVLNLDTECTIDEAVGMMMGIWKVDCYIDVEHCYKMEDCPEADPYEFNVAEYLDGERNDVIKHFQEARLEGDASDAELQILFDKIEEFDTNFMKKAKIYFCLVKDELAKGDKSELRIVDNKITLASLDQWWSEGKVITHSIFKDIQQNVSKPSDDDLILSEKVTFGLLQKALIGLYIEMSKDLASATKAKLTANSTLLNKYGQPHNPNFSEIASKLMKTLDPKYDGEQAGYSQRSIRARLSDAHNTLEKFISDNAISGQK
jgi:hypothetical protein